MEKVDGEEEKSENETKGKEEEEKEKVEVEEEKGRRQRGRSENGFLFYGMSQFVTSQNFQNVTGKAQLSQVFWYFFHVYVTSTSLLLHYTRRNTCQYRRVNDKFHNFTISEKRNHH